MQGGLGYYVLTPVGEYLLLSTGPSISQILLVQCMKPHRFLSWSSLKPDNRRRFRSHIPGRSLQDISANPLPRLLTVRFATLRSLDRSLLTGNDQVGSFKGWYQFAFRL